MRISDWSSDVCSSDLLFVSSAAITPFSVRAQEATPESLWPEKTYQEDEFMPTITFYNPPKEKAVDVAIVVCPGGGYSGHVTAFSFGRSEEHTSELQSLMRS